MLRSVSGRNWQYYARRKSGSRENGGRETSINQCEERFNRLFIVCVYLFHPENASSLMAAPCPPYSPGSRARAQPASLGITR